MSEHAIVLPELEELANEIGDFICYWGFKKIHGRLWTHLYLSEEGLDAGQLMQRLKVSKALISLSINDLLRNNVILESKKSARGTQTYVANPNVLDVILNILRRREKKMLARTESSFKMVSSLSRDTLLRASIYPARLDSLGNMIYQAQNTLNALLELSVVDFQSWAPVNESSPSR